MSKIFSVFIVLFYSFITIFAQQSDGSLLQHGSARQSDYSESASYQPRQLVETTVKPKKDKKSKKGAAVMNESSATENDLQNSGEKEIIKIPVFVFDQNRKLVLDLKRSDLTLFIDGAEREILSFESGAKPLNLLLVLDISPSTAYQPKDIQNFAANLIESLKPADKLQIIKFSAELKALSEATTDRQNLKKAVQRIQMGDGTSLYDSVRTIFREQISVSPDRGKTLILLTDGVDTTSRKANYMTSLIEAERVGAVVFPFYLDTFAYNQKALNAVRNPIFSSIVPRPSVLSKEDYDLGKLYLTDLAALSGGNTFVVNDLSKLDRRDFENTLSQLGAQYYISFDTRSGAANSSARKQIKIRVNRPNLTVRTRASYFAVEKK